MRTLILAPYKDGATWVSIKKSFENLGHQTLIVCPRTERKKIISSIRLFSPTLIITGKENLIEYKNYLNENVYCPIIGWNTDKRASFERYGPKIIKTWAMCDLMFFNSKTEAERFQKKYGIPSYGLQQGCDPDMHSEPNDIDKIEIPYDVTFIGNINNQIHTGRKVMLRELKDSPYVNFNHYKNVFGKEHNQIVYASKINISHHGFNGFKVSQSVRDYKIMCAGGFLLTEYSIGLEKHFKEGIHCEFYRNINELFSKINFYLKNPAKRNKIAKEGQLNVLKYHTYDHRVKFILDILRYQACKT